VRIEVQFSFASGKTESGRFVPKPLQRGRTQLLELLDKVIDFFTKLRRFGRGDPSGPQTVLLDAGEGHELAHEPDAFLSGDITVQVIAVALVSAADKDPVHTFLEGQDDVMGGDAPTAHDPNHPDVGRVLQPTDPGQVSSGVRSPGAQKADDLGFEVLAAHDGSFCSGRRLRVDGRWLRLPKRKKQPQEFRNQNSALPRAKLNLSL
jgi:hypothetical protein